MIFSEDRFALFQIIREPRSVPPGAGQTKALRPVMSRPTISDWISAVPS